MATSYAAAAAGKVSKQALIAGKYAATNRLGCGAVVKEIDCPG